MKHVFKIFQRNLSRRCGGCKENNRSIWFGKYLLLTNTVSSGLLMGIGDLVQQEIEYRRKILPKRYDWGRLLRMTIVGALLGPVHHYFYAYLDKLYPDTNLASVFKKMAIDQIVGAPVCIALFFYGMGTLEKKSFKESHTELKEKFVTVYIVDLCIWPVTQFVNFYFIPLQYRVVYSNLVTMIYDVFLSYVKHVDSPTES